MDKYYVDLAGGKKARISLAAKWAPSEKSRYQKDYKAVTKIAEYLGIKFGQYRKHYLRPLRRNLNILETTNRDDVDFSKLPAICLFKNFESLQKRDETRFEYFLNNIEKGDVVLKTDGLSPEHFVEYYLSRPLQGANRFVEFAWKQFIEKRSPLEAYRSLPVLIVNCKDLLHQVGMEIDKVTIISILLFWLSICEGSFKNQFYINRRFLKLEKDTLFDRVYELNSIVSKMLESKSELEETASVDDDDLSLESVVNYITEELVDVCDIMNVPDENRPKSVVVLHLDGVGTENGERPVQTKHGILINYIAVREGRNTNFMLPKLPDPLGFKKELGKYKVIYV
jgi:hypothetical protein